jgi:predicted RNA-binding Zn-ribbon protein involved in translation (DUF1610 family)
MISALWIMSNIAKNSGRNYRIKPSLYESLREKHAKSLSIRMKGRLVSSETLEKMSASKKGQTYEKVKCEVCGKVTGRNAYTRLHGKNCGKTKVSLSDKEMIKCEICGKTVDKGNYIQYHGPKCGKPQVRPKKKCEYCGKEVSYTNYTRWHGPACKLNTKKEI